MMVEPRVLRDRGFGQESVLEVSEFSAYLRVLAGISAYLRVFRKLGAAKGPRDWP